MSEREKVIVVDKQNNVMGSKWRDELTDDDCWRMVSIWVENSKEQVLLQQRSLDKKLSPGAWTVAAEGTVGVGEDLLSAAKRELEEEVGISNVKLAPIKLTLVRMEFGWRQMQTYRTVCDLPSEELKIQTDEVAQIEWIDKQQFIDEVLGKRPYSRKYPSSIRFWPKVYGLS